MTSTIPQALFFFSTEGGQSAAKSADSVRSPAVARSDPAYDGRLMIDRLRARWPEFCTSIFAPWDIRWFFDEHDFHKHGGSFLYNHVLMVIQKENEEMLSRFCQEWSECNKGQFHHLKNLGIDQIFHEKDIRRHSRGFLENALLYMRCAYDRALAVEQNLASLRREEALASRDWHQMRSNDCGPYSREKQYPKNQRIKGYRLSSDSVDGNVREDRRSSSFSQRRSSNYLPPASFHHPHHPPVAQSFGPYDGPPPPPFSQFGPPSPFPPSAGSLPFPNLPILMPYGEDPHMEPYLMPVAGPMPGGFGTPRSFGHPPSVPMSRAPSMHYLPEHPPRSTADRSTLSQPQPQGPEPHEKPYKPRNYKGKQYKPPTLRRSSSSSHDSSHDGGFRDSSADCSGPWRSQNRRTTSEWKAEQERSLPAPSEYLEELQTPKPKDVSSLNNGNDGAPSRSRTTSELRSHLGGESEPPLSLRVGPRFVGEDVHNILEVIIKNAENASHQEVQEFFSSIAPVVSVTRPGQWITVKFGSTAHVRKVLEECRNNHTLVPETKRCDWTSSPYSPSKPQLGRRPASVKADGSSPRKGSSTSTALPAGETIRETQHEITLAKAVETKSSVSKSQDTVEVLNAATKAERKQNEVRGQTQPPRNDPNRRSNEKPVLATSQGAMEALGPLVSHSMADTPSSSKPVAKRPPEDRTMDNDAEKTPLKDSHGGNSTHEASGSAKNSSEKALLSVVEYTPGVCIGAGASVDGKASLEKTGHCKDTTAPQEGSNATLESSDVSREGFTKQSGKKKKAGKKHKMILAVQESPVGSANLSQNKVSSTEASQASISDSKTASATQSSAKSLEPKDSGDPTNIPSQPERNETQFLDNIDRSPASQPSSDRPGEDVDSVPVVTDKVAVLPGPPEILQSDDRANTVTSSTVSAESVRMEDEVSSLSPSGNGSSNSINTDIANASPMGSTFLAEHNFKEWRSTYDKLMGRLSAITHDDKSSWLRTGESLKQSLLRLENQARAHDAKLGMATTSSLRKKLNKKFKDRSRSQKSLVEELTLLSERLHSQLEKIQIDTTRNRSAYPGHNPREMTMNLWGADPPSSDYIFVKTRHSERQNSPAKADCVNRDDGITAPSGGNESSAGILVRQDEESQTSSSRGTSETFGRGQEELTVSLPASETPPVEVQTGEMHGVYNSALNNAFEVNYDGTSSALEDQNKATPINQHEETTGADEPMLSATPTPIDGPLHVFGTSSAVSDTISHSMSRAGNTRSEDSNDIAVITSATTLSDPEPRRLSLKSDSGISENMDCKKTSSLTEPESTSQKSGADVEEAGKRTEQRGEQAGHSEQSENTRPKSTPPSSAILINTPRPMSYAKAVASKTAETLPTTKTFSRTQPRSTSSQPVQWSGERRWDLSQTSMPRGRRSSLNMQEPPKRDYSKGKQPQGSSRSSERRSGSSSDWSVGPEGQWQPVVASGSKPPSSFKDPISRMDPSQRRKGG